MKNLLLIDGNSILNRAFYGIMNSKLLTTKDGTPTNAVFGFLAIMFKILEEINPEYMAVAFDLKAKTKRHMLYADYKGTRKGMPDELAVQMPIIKEILVAMNIEILEKEGYEADDILGTLAKFGVKEGLNVTVLTGDRDYFQLAEDNITIRIPRTKQGKTETEDFDKNKVLEVYGVEPIKLIEVKGLMGDTSDNIPGVPGVGEKTALNLIKQYGSIENLYKTLPENKEVKGKLRERLEENEELALLSRTLGEIDINAEVEKDLNKLKNEEWNYLEVYEIFKTLSFNKYIERFNLQKYATTENINEIVEEKLDVSVEENTSKEDIKSLISTIKTKSRIYFYVDIVGKEDNLQNESLLNLKTVTNSIIKKAISGTYVYNEIENKTYYILGQEFIKEFKEILEEKSVLKIGYKLKETYILLKQEGIEPQNMMFDISVASYLLNSTQNKYNIEKIIEDNLNINLDIYENMEKIESEENIEEQTLEDNKNEQPNTHEQEQQLNLFNMGNKELNNPNNINNNLISENNEDTTSKKFIFKYGIFAFSIFKLYDVLIEKLRETDQLDLFNNIEMPLTEVLAEMQLNGIYVDKKELENFGSELKERLNELTKEIHELSGGIEFNISSPKQLGEVLFEKLQLPVQKKTKSGYSTDVEVLEKLKSYHPVIEKILEYRQLMKFNSTYVEGMIPCINPETNRIHSTFHQTVTATGRISSTEPNLQNIPTRMELGKQLRKVFKATDNNIFIDADYSQIELRVLAHISNDGTMIEAFNNNEDIHKQVASKVFKKKYDKVTKEERSYAKAVNFGIVYGISDFGLAEQLHIPIKQAKEYIEQYLKKYKGIKLFMENIVKEATEKGYVETLFKRKRYVEELKSKNFNIRHFGKRVAMNTPIQGTAADIMKIAMINVYQKLKENNLKSKLVLQVHDEIMIEAVEEERKIVKTIIKDSMENAAKLNVELKVDIEEGNDWYSAK